MIARTTLLFGLALAASGAQAYCIHNQLRDRSVYVEQVGVKDKLREDRVLSRTLGPGEQTCCQNLDCNPGGRPESVVELILLIEGEPTYWCGHREGSNVVKVTGDGRIRVMHNPRHPRSSIKYITRIRSGQKDLTGPSGLACHERKGKP
ncbi:MAG TPA: hypothetical protein VEC19_00940 [Usitatibacter sp.]|nr:hypothetical protein [Usitatibacter sp.]